MSRFPFAALIALAIVCPLLTTTVSAAEDLKDSPELKKLMQHTADFIVKAQDKKAGGWDYSYVHKRKLHTVTAVWNLTALGIMKDLGISVPQSTIDRGLHLANTGPL